MRLYLLFEKIDNNVLITKTLIQHCSLH